MAKIENMALLSAHSFEQDAHLRSDYGRGGSEQKWIKIALDGYASRQAVAHFAETQSPIDAERSCSGPQKCVPISMHPSPKNDDRHVSFQPADDLFDPASRSLFVNILRQDSSKTIENLDRI